MLNGENFAFTNHGWIGTEQWAEKRDVYFMPSVRHLVKQLRSGYNKFKYLRW